VCDDEGTNGVRKNLAQRCGKGTDARSRIEEARRLGGVEKYLVAKEFPAHQNDVAGLENKTTQWGVNPQKVDLMK
jgi:hypothetical protein